MGTMECGAVLVYNPLTEICDKRKVALAAPKRITTSVGVEDINSSAISYCTLFSFASIWAICSWVQSSGELHALSAALLNCGGQAGKVVGTMEICLGGDNKVPAVLVVCLGGVQINVVCSTQLEVLIAEGNAYICVIKE